MDIGDDLSPKKQPDKIAPPQITGLKFMALEIDMEIIPAVDAVPKLVPVKKEDKDSHIEELRRDKGSPVINYVGNSTRKSPNACYHPNEGKDKKNGLGVPYTCEGHGPNFSWAKLSHVSVKRQEN